ncbi:MAG: alpha/beta hydrolase, partial [Gammaproteobacteria bacterium]|nr:alpha/beta hydrolase [Gammaproteobacteria bacterium]
RWGEENHDAPKVLLMHGWNGRATQMGAFIAPLLAAGYQVIAFDAPAHGHTPGNSTDILRITDALNTVIREFSPIDSVIAHSFGAVVLTYALKQKLELRKAVCISAPAQTLDAAQAFCRGLRLPHRATNNFFQQIDAYFDSDIWSRLSPLKNVATLSIPALIVHDKNDTTVPLTHGENLVNAWPGADLLVTNHLGHQRILRHPPTIEQIVSFLKKSTQE